MNFLIIGLGSIGQRHLRNLSKLKQKINFYAIRRKFITPPLNDLNEIQKFSLKKKYKIKYLRNFNEVPRKINAVLICTPSSQHMNDFKKLNFLNSYFFIEKPLATTKKDINFLKKVKNKHKIMSGFQFRFNPIILELKKFIKKNKNKINQIIIHHGENVKDFHKYENYKISYTSKKKLGGGVVFSQIHDIDIAHFFFNDEKVSFLNSVSKKISKLEIDVEDTSISNFLVNKILININLNFYEKPKDHTIKIILENDVLIADLNNQTIRYRNKIKRFNFERNDIFLNEIKYFFKRVKSKKNIHKDYSLHKDIQIIENSMKMKNDKK